MRYFKLLIALAVAAVSLGAQTINLGPTVVLIVHPPGGGLPIGTVVNLTVQAQDNDGTIESILVYRNGIQIGATTNASGIFDSTISSGLNNFHAVAIDNSGNTGRSETITITSNLEPTVRIIEPVGSVTHYSLSNTVTIRAEASDPDGSLSQVRLLENGRIIASDFQAPFEFSYRPLNFGTFTLEVQAVDAFGLTGSQTRTVRYVRVQDDFTGNVNPSVGTNVTLFGNNVAATRQKGEPNHAGAAGGKSIWFAWRAALTGTVTIDTVGSDFDTVLGVYTNAFLQINAVSNLVEVASSDDDPANAPLSKVKFNGEAGRTYFIAVDGRDGFAGNVVLNIRQTAGSTNTKLPNDFIASAITTPPSGIHNSSNVGATKEADEPDHADNRGGASMWWRVSFPTLSTTIRISTAGSSFDTLLAVYTNAVTNPREPIFTAPLMENLRVVAENDDGAGSTNRTSFVEFVTRPNTTYWIAVDGYNGAQGNIRLVLSTLQQSPPPPNNQFVAASVLSGSSALTNVNTFSASTEFGEPVIVPGRQSGKSVWYRWVAPATGPVYVSTKWSDFDTLIGVYMGTNINNLLPVASNDDDGGLQTSALVFNAIAGVEYRFVVAGYQNAGGDMVLMLNQPALLPPRMVTQVIGKTIALSVEDLRGTAILESSSDLVNWTPIRVIEQEEPQVQIEPDSGQSQLFYRVRQLE
ncbi:MAG TPA: Ig-like domain-containing protein [Verrucomicrobiae bacterium]